MTQNEFKARLLLQNLGGDCTDIMDIDHTNLTCHYSGDGQHVIDEILCAINYIADDPRIKGLFDDSTTNSSTN